MDRKLLKWLRLVMPGLIAMVLLLPVKAQLATLYDSTLPFEVGAIELPLFALIIGIVYHVLGIRGYFNFKFHQRVTRNIRQRLWSAARPTPPPSDWDDKKSRDTFYNLVDNDNSLTARTDMIYFNGALWTSAADVRAVGLIVSAIALGMIISNPNDAAAIVLLGVNAAAVVLSIPVSHLITKQHIKLGDEQLDYIAAHLKIELDRLIANYGL